MKLLTAGEHCHAQALTIKRAYRLRSTPTPVLLIGGRIMNGSFINGSRLSWERGASGSIDLSGLAVCVVASLLVPVTTGSNSSF